VASQTEVAEFFAVSLATLTGAWSARGCPLEKTDAGYDLGEIARWRIQYERGKRPRTEDEALLDAISGPGGEDWKERWLRGKALLTEEQLAEVQGKLVDLEEVAPILQRTASMLADAIRRLESEFGPEAANIMRTPLERMSEEVEDMLDRDDDD